MLHSGDPGGKTQCFNVTAPKDAPSTFAPKFPLPSNQPAYFVAVDGSDTHNGSLNFPFATIEAALQAARQNPGAGAIVLRSGVHYLSKTLELGPAGM